MRSPELVDGSIEEGHEEGERPVCQVDEQSGWHPNGAREFDPSWSQVSEEVFKIEPGLDGVEMVNMEMVTWKFPLVPYNAEKINCYCPYYSWVSNSPENHEKTNHVQYVSFFHFVSRVKAKARERNNDPVYKTEVSVLIWGILDSVK